MGTGSKWSAWFTKPKLQDVFWSALALGFTDFFTYQLSLLYLQGNPGFSPPVLIITGSVAAIIDYSCFCALFKLEPLEALVVAVGFEVADVAGLLLEHYLLVSEEIFFLLIGIIGVSLLVAVPVFATSLRRYRLLNKK